MASSTAPACAAFCRNASSCTEQAGSGGGRSLAVDAVRGLAVAGMIFVNNPGDWRHLAPPFAHAAWHGWTPTDLVFPAFLFLVGTSAVFSLSRRREEGASVPSLLGHVAKRGFVICIIGWALALFPFGIHKIVSDGFGAWWPYLWDRIEHLRLPGVLPRIGLAYALGAAALMGLRTRTAVALAIAALLGMHTALLLSLGALGPAENLQRTLDLALIGENHLYRSEPTDPEGLLSTLTAVGSLLFGALAGGVLRADGCGRSRARTLLLAGVAAAIAGQLGHLWLPINKKLWTGSFVLLTAGLTACALGAATYLVDERRWSRPFAPLIVFGRNPLAAFVISGALAILSTMVTLPLEGAPTIHAWGLGILSFIDDPMLRSHSYAAMFVLLMFAILRGMEWRGWYWKV